MKFDNFEVLLLKTDGRCFDERTVKGVSYFVAEAGVEYIVKITIRRDIQTGNFQAQRLKVGLYIDGQDVNYWKRLDSTEIPKEQNEMSTCFLGFKKNNDELTSFVFTTPDLRSEFLPNDELNYNSIGQIKIVMFEAISLEGIFNNNSGAYGVPKKSKISEGRKFWQQPSASTVGGQNISPEREKFLPLIRWKVVNSEPSQTLIANYHTAEMLNIIENLGDPVNTTENNLKRLFHEDTTSTSNKISRNYPNNLTNKPITTKKDNSNQNENEVSYIPVIKLLPLIDLTEDEDSSTSVTYVKKES